MNNIEHKRYPMLDCLRGLVLISMIGYHMVWDIVYLFGRNWSWYRSGGARIWQQSICWSFILLSGFCWSFGRVKWKRGMTVFLAGLLITIVTAVAMPKNIVLFGVLTLLGSCMLFMIPLEKLLKHIKSPLGLLIFLFLFLFTKNVNRGELGMGRWKVIDLPESWYANLVTTYFGFPSEGFYSTDYFSLIPWMFLFVSGYFLYRLFREHEWMRYLEGGTNCRLGMLGRHSLLIYMLHQPLLYVVLHVVYG